MNKRTQSIETTLVDELNELGLPNMAATLDSMYHSSSFLHGSSGTNFGTYNF